MLVMAYRTNYTALMTEKLDEDCQDLVLKHLFLVEQECGNFVLPNYSRKNLTDELHEELGVKINSCDVCKRHKLTDWRCKNHFNYYWSQNDQRVEWCVCNECSEETLYPYIHYEEYYRSLRYGNLEELQNEMIDEHWVNFMRHICGDEGKGWGLKSTS
jgi:isopentenyldiphosphate isomerase